MIDDLTVGEEQHAVSMCGGDRVVGDHHDRQVVVIDRVSHEIEDACAGARVEGAGWLIGEQNVWPRHESSGDGDALLLTA